MPSTGGLDSTTAMNEPYSFFTPCFEVIDSIIYYKYPEVGPGHNRDKKLFIFEKLVAFFVSMS